VADSTPPESQQFPCPKCGADSGFDAATQALTCAHCGHTEAIGEEGEEEIYEYDLQAALRNAPMGGRRQEAREVKCTACAATVEVAPEQTALRCGYCDQPVVVIEEDAARIVPESLIPFRLARSQAHQKLRKWLASRWFRPGDLATAANVKNLRSRYVPAWTYDADTDSHWTAMSGYYYWETETYTAHEDGRMVTKTRRVRKTRWVPSWGDHHEFFNDWLVYATRGLPAHLLDDLGRWALSSLEPYDAKYLAGHESERYAVDLEGGWNRARKEIQRAIRSACGRKVPGDTHRGLRVSTTYHDMTFKHLLLPLWVVAYRYRGKPYRIVVNGQTGQVDGEAPYSWGKIALLVLAICTVIGIIVAVVMSQQ
jgi:DNA-directed RNA polymerase subunit RPC12/RpoP